VSAFTISRNDGALDMVGDIGAGSDFLERFGLPVFRRFSRSVKYAQNFDAFLTWYHTIVYEVPGIWNDEFTSAENATGTTQRWIFRQQTHGFMDLLNDLPGHCRVVTGNVLSFFIKIGQGFY
jgi:hypothetical protein